MYHKLVTWCLSGKMVSVAGCLSDVELLGGSKWTARCGGSGWLYKVTRRCHLCEGVCLRNTDHLSS